MSFAETWIELEILILSELSQKKKDKHHIISLICGVKKYGTNDLFTKQKQIMDMEG